MPTALDLSYPKILGNFGSHLIEGRTESRAFLGWFLENYFRLDEAEAQDTICDGPDDKGIDGIFIDNNLEQVVVFQTKLFQKLSRTLGDVTLKEFAGTLDQLKNRESIEHLTNTTSNKELKGLIKESNIHELIEKGYRIRGIFVTNVNIDGNAKNYLAQRSDINVYDGDRLNSDWVAPGLSTPVHTRVSFRIEEDRAFSYQTPEATVYVAPLLATELVEMPGLQSGELFAWNVRKALGRTKVNKAIAESVNDQSEHKNFLLYHNGLTILAEEASLEDEYLTLDGYTVVNGCQSLTTLYEQRSKITSELRLLTRIIMLPPHNELAAKITRHSNNQNSINARDLQSNSTIQRRLQTEFQSKFKDTYFYEIKRGETQNAPNVITNEEAARLLLAFDLQQPWSCHQSYKLFDELHSDIFGRPEVTASRIVALNVLHEAIVESLPLLNDKLLANYKLSQFFLLYLLRQALQEDNEGKNFIGNAGDLLNSISPIKLKTLILPIIEDLITDLNAEIDERNETTNPFDHKRELKSPTAIKNLAKNIIPTYLKAIRRDRATSFSAELNKLRNN
ncbi:AIPR family protein [Marinobacter sp.]|uniref:AIPR family protein n=1 Tax=Marinobacter sp. TaxID=50741 RepID=UPI003A931C32